MSWYFNTGTKVVNVDVGKGEVVAVRPQSHVYVDATQENNVNLKYHVRKSILQRCSAPKGLKKQRFVPVVPVEEKLPEVVEVSPFASAVKEGIRASKKQK